MPKIIALGNRTLLQQIGLAISKVNGNCLRNYQRAIVTGRLSHLPITAPSHLSFLHDDWCAFNQGRACDCDPDLLLNGECIWRGKRTTH
jgi:hypothetical protein